MAVRDVKKYYYEMLSQYLEEKQNLEDFESALKDGLITEEQMNDAMEAVSDLEKNYFRLSYIMYLLNKPKRKEKGDIYTKQYKNILDELVRLGADSESVRKANSDALVHFKARLKALKDKKVE